MHIQHKDRAYIGVFILVVRVSTIFYMKKQPMKILGGLDLLVWIFKVTGSHKEFIILILLKINTLKKINNFKFEMLIL